MNTQNQMFSNRADLDPYSPGPHSAKGLLAADGGDMIVEGFSAPSTWAPTTNVAGMIDGIDTIRLTRSNGKSYEYTLFIIGGSVKYNTKLTFTDESGDSYVKRIYAAAHNAHTIDYNSPQPNIVQVDWEY